MKKSLLASMLELAGFASIGFLFLIWFMGNKKNALPGAESPNDPYTIRAEVGNSYSPRSAEPSSPESYTSSSDYSKRTYSMPETVTRGAEDYKSMPASEKASKTHSETTASVGQKATAVRSWKGVHRDESYAWLCYERFGAEITSLSREHGLYPDVFMARIIAYSYEYTKDPRVDPADRNFTALLEPKGENRARFRSASESLKAYAVLHAGEVSRLSREGALGKTDRTWTMNKIIDSYAFVSDLAKEAPDRSAYQGRIGGANKVSDERNYQREMVGEAAKMVSSVDNVIKKRRAENAGYSNWEDYLDSLPEEERGSEEDKATSNTTAVSKKKAFNLSRRVDAKRGN